jgi:hypothetical protein
MKSTTLILLLLLSLFFSCTKHTEESRPKHTSYLEKEDSTLNVAKYVYIDRDSILHVKLKCGQPMFSADELNHKYYVKRLQRKDISYKELEKCCAVCVSDEIYDRLKQYIDSIHGTNGLNNSNK